MFVTTATAIFETNFILFYFIFILIYMVVGSSGGPWLPGLSYMVQI